MGKISNATIERHMENFLIWVLSIYFVTFASGLRIIENQHLNFCEAAL